MWLIIAAFMLSTPEQRKAGAESTAQIYCHRLNAERGLPCKVESMAYSETGNEYVDHAAALMTVAGTRAVLSLSFRYGKWYIDSFDVESFDAGH